jgi:hypothetical protein
MRANLLYTYGGSVGNLSEHMIYDMKNETLAAFSSCRFEQSICFGDVNADDQLDFLHFNNDDFCTSLPSSAKFEVKFYSFDEKGKVVLQKDKKGVPYSIIGNSGEDYSQDSFNIIKLHWPVQIKN